MPAKQGFVADASLNTVVSCPSNIQSVAANERVVSSKKNPLCFIINNLYREDKLNVNRDYRVFSRNPVGVSKNDRFRFRNKIDCYVEFINIALRLNFRKFSSFMFVHEINEE